MILTRTETKSFLLSLKSCKRYKWWVRNYNSLLLWDFHNCFPCFWMHLVRIRSFLIVFQSGVQRFDPRPYRPAVRPTCRMRNWHSRTPTQTVRPNACLSLEEEGKWSLISDIRLLISTAQAPTNRLSGDVSFNHVLVIRERIHLYCIVSSRAQSPLQSVPITLTSYFQQAL